MSPTSHPCTSPGHCRTVRPVRGHRNSPVLHGIVAAWTLRPACSSPMPDTSDGRQRPPRPTTGTGPSVACGPPPSTPGACGSWPVRRVRVAPARGRHPAHLDQPVPACGDPVPRQRTPTREASGLTFGRTRREQRCPTRAKPFYVGMSTCDISQSSESSKECLVGDTFHHPPHSKQSSQ